MRRNFRGLLWILIGVILCMGMWLQDGKAGSPSSSSDLSRTHSLALPPLPRQPALAVQGAKRSPDGLWQGLDEAELTASPNIQKQRQIVPTRYRTLRLDLGVLKQLLATAPMEFTEAAKKASMLMTLPMPEGTYARFLIRESPMMSPGLARQFPDMKTYSGQGIDDPTATVRLDWSSFGFHAMVLSANDTIYIDPYARGDIETYISYFRHDLRREAAKQVKCLWEPSLQLSIPAAPNRVQQTGDTLRTLRLALAATAQYTAFYGGTKQGALAGMMTTMNRVNGIYQRDLEIRLSLIDRELDIIYTDPNNQPYRTPGDAGKLADDNQPNLDRVIGDANYDMGHVFSVGGGGVGGAGPCITGSKAMGATALDAPRGDAFDVDFVAHEMIHQFNGGHTFNALLDAPNQCNKANRSPNAAYETGSGSTIASYAGICECADYQRMSDDYFNGNSIDEFLNYITNIAQFGGADCTVKTPTGNRPPSVTTTLNVNVPARTPFTLTATGSDPDGDALTYCWEEYDLGNSSACLPDLDEGERPIFRSMRPTTSPSRTFPASNPPQPGESLPTTTRNMRFRCTVRDGKGGVTKATTQVHVVATAGRTFAVLPSRKTQAWVAGSTQTVTWDVAETNRAPISCQQVRILFSIDGGKTFPITLGERVPNTGSATISVPASVPSTTEARIKVEAVGNVFFNVSDTDFHIHR